MKQLILNLQEAKSSQSNCSQFECLLHKRKICSFKFEFIQLFNQNVFGLFPKCIQCLDSFLPHSSIPFKQCFEIIHFKFNIQEYLRQPVAQIQKIKDQIKDQSNRKKVQRQKCYSLYQQLSFTNKIFLEQTHPILQCISQKLQSDQIHFQHAFTKQFKQAIKNPEFFQEKFNIKATKNNLKLLFQLKYSLLNSLNFIHQFLQDCGLNFEGKSFETQLLSPDFQKIRSQIIKFVEWKKKQVIEKKMLTLTSIKCMVKTETKHEYINSYMSELANLYKDYSKVLNSVKFSTSQKDFMNFNFNLSRTTVVLRNPNLIDQKVYKEVPYQNQFIYVDDGEYAFKNQYRADIFCQEAINLERNANILIGSQFLQNHNQYFIQETKQFSFGKFLQIDKFLAAQEQHFLRLRLNAEEFDKVSIRLTWSNSLQSFYKKERDQFININLYLVPDSGQNRKLYGIKNQAQIDTQSYSQSIAKKIKGGQQVHLVLEDDVLSLKISKDCSFIVLNETRKQIIKSIRFTKPKPKWNNSIQFQLPLYAAIVLYSTISEIELLKDFKKH